MRRPEALGKKMVSMDWDDSAVMTYPIVSGLYRTFAEKMGYVKPSAEVIKGLWGRPLDDILQGMFPGQDAGQLRRDFDAAVPTDHAVEPYPWFNQTLRQLETDGYLLSVVSSTPARGMARTVKKFNMDMGRFAFVQTDEGKHVNKPHPGVFDPLLAQLAKQGMGRDEVVYTGDSLKDMEAAWGAGIMFVAVLTGFTRAEEFMRVGLEREFIMSNMGELPDWLNGKI